MEALEAHILKILITAFCVSGTPNKVATPQCTKAVEICQTSFLLKKMLTNHHMDMLEFEQCVKEENK